MPLPLVECIPNFSEARRPEVITAIRQAIQSVPSIHLLDQHSDMDHNRTVLTFVGPPGEVGEAAFRAIAKAAELIDLDKHQGEHPRIGATDVVPFVPISGVTMQECVEIARRLGERVGSDLGIPVYLYEAAAARPERINLENIRRGEYETLKEEIASLPERSPDYGPARLGSAGATVIGARQPLIAFNVYLATEDVTIAERIARAIRQSSGGLRFVKALGMLVEGRAQVSMNLTDFRRTPVARTVELIRREAARYGTAIHHSELVGLIPQEALLDAAQWYLQLDGFEVEQVLEQRLATVSQEGERQAGVMEAQDFLTALASGSATPGGGSAAAYTGAEAAALVAMVARVTSGKKRFAEVEGQMQAILARAEALRAELTSGVQKDAAAFEQVMAALKLPKETAEQAAIREQALAAASLGAALEPLAIAEKAVEVMDLAAQVVAAGNIRAISDGATAAALARAALASAGYNVRINVLGLRDPSVPGMLARLQELDATSRELEIQVQKTLVTRGGSPCEAIGSLAAAPALCCSVGGVNPPCRLHAESERRVWEPNPGNLTDFSNGSPAFTHCNAQPECNPDPPT